MAKNAKGVWLTSMRSLFGIGNRRVDAERTELLPEPTALGPRLERTTPEEQVWFSDIFQDIGLVKMFTSDRVVDDLAAAAASQEANFAGEPLGPEHFSKRIWRDRGKRIKRLPPISFCNGDWVLSEKAADVLRAHDLGGGALYPVAMLQGDKKTPLEGEWFSWNFGNVKEAFVREASRVKVNEYSDRIVSPPDNMQDGDLTVSSAALDGPDVWVDPTLKRSLFISGRLAASLRKARLEKAFRLKRCGVEA